jgi:hypothetical protein
MNMRWLKRFSLFHESDGSLYFGMLLPYKGIDYWYVFSFKELRLV